MDEKKEIINRINKIAGRYSPYEVFTDWTRCCALAISNAVTAPWKKIRDDREKMYMDTVGRYTKDEVHIFSEMLGLLAVALEKDMRDVLGDIYMESGMGSKTSGQFFTPFHLSELAAELSVYGADEDGKYRIAEPSCGGGGMIIATAKALKSRGINYQKKWTL